MIGAIFGLIGVLVGAGISWFQKYWTDRDANNKNARYLAIRIVCILDKYLIDCAEVVRDNGLCFGQRTSEGYLSPQVESPAPPVYPNDVDWKSIDHDLMYKILALPAEVEDGERMIKACETVAYPPDFEDLFNERKFYYSKFGLIACKISKELCAKYDIRQKTYHNWDPETDFKHEYDAAAKWLYERREAQWRFVNQVLGPK